jgi:Fe-S cluster assembly scaffold protein SufB
VVELAALDNAEIKYSTVQNWYPATKTAKADLQLRDETGFVSRSQF